MSIVHISGTVHPDGHFTPGWWGTAQDGATVGAGSDSRWAAVAVDGAGRILASAPATLETILFCPGSGESGARLTAFLPLADGTAFVALRHSGVEVFRRAVPEPAAVSLELSAVHGKRLQRELVTEIPVQINGHTPPAGAHLVARWEAPGSGHPPLPLPLIDVGGGQAAVVRLNLAELPTSDRCRLTVSYSDGLRTVTVTSSVLEVEQRPASPAIRAPQPLTRIHDDGVLLLAGRLDGDGDPAALRWLLDDQVVGRGPTAFVVRPGAGKHTVTLQHGAEQSQVEINVHSGSRTSAKPPHWIPPWRTGPLRSVGVALSKGDTP